MRIVIAAALLLLSNPLQAFSKTGHQMICDMAYQLVSDATRVQIDSLIAASPYQQFSQSCSWADEVRADPAFDYASALHFVNFARDKQQVSAADCPAHGCILSAITDMQQRLADDNTDWQALLFLAHFIGDLHQPLHVSFADDLGGNRTAVYFYGLPNNLHGVWDFALLKQLGYETDHSKAATLFNRIGTKQRSAWQQGDVLSWANESAALTLEIYQGYTPGMLIDDSYVLHYQAVLEQRLQQAGVRLALLLDQSLGATAN
ncbi:S1/P1 nuclease [Rheinheimera sp. NSM]|uniref:S1/P1 nuclease n=1 Tax=Rheinheimera sp. NSM TaxID=3457884 RepID=UPI00403732DB